MPWLTDFHVCILCTFICLNISKHTRTITGAVGIWQSIVASADAIIAVQIFERISCQWTACNEDFYDGGYDKEDSGMETVSDFELLCRQRFGSRTRANKQMENGCACAYPV